MRPLQIHRKPFPLTHIPLRNTRIITRHALIPQDAPDLGHGADADDPLDGEVGLVRERACEVVC